MDLDRLTDEAVLRSSDGLRLAGCWDGFYSNHLCETCGTQPAVFTFTVESPWETETPVRIQFRIDSGKEYIEVAEVDPANRPIFLKYFGWVFAS